MEQSRRNLRASLRAEGGAISPGKQLQVAVPEGKIKIVYEVHQGLLEIHDNETTAEGVDFWPRLR